MPLQLIGAGLPRTGTSSLREALRYLLNAPIYHMSETLRHPEHAAVWVDAIEGNPPEWDIFLAGYAAGVDAPFSNCWSDLAAAYPEAPVLLSHRGDPEIWYRSMEATVLPRTREILRKGASDPLVPLFEVLFSGVFADIDDRDQIIAGYERWLTEVRGQVEPGRLVEWSPGDGWEPICAALGVPVPDWTFPHENSTASYVARKDERARRDGVRVAGWLSGGGRPPLDPGARD